jgi:TPR repeat protein
MTAALPMIGQDVTPKAPDVKRLIERCDAQDGSKCYFLGLAYEHGVGIGTSKDLALAAFRKSCDLKFGAGCLSLAQIAPEKAEAALTEACDFNYGRACAELAFRDGTTESARLNLLQKGCESKYGAACTQLAELEKSSDPTKSAKHFELGCDNGDGAGCYRLGKAVLATDKAKAGELFKKACDLHFPAPNCPEFR